jgi:hypothetical protein
VVAGRVSPYDGRLMMERVLTQRGLQPFDWYCEARLVSRTAAYDGPLLECVRRWLRLSSPESSSAFILLEGGIGKVLKPTELGQIARNIEFSSL